jgi:hypothetical protein
MVVVRLRRLECIRTGSGERTEEPYLIIRADDAPPATWGPVSMRDGDTVRIDWGEIEGDRVGIFLFESDTPARHDDGVVYAVDDSVGGIAFLPECGIEIPDETFAGEGSYEVILPRHQGMTGGTVDPRRYKLYFDLLFSRDSVLPSMPYSLELVSLHCNDAQEYADHVFIKVNGERVWGPRRMRTGDTLSLESEIPIAIRAGAIITLWEEDSSTRSDFFGEFRLQVGEDFDFDHNQPHTFSRDRGIVGDARYTLTYRVRRTGDSGR